MTKRGGKSLTLDQLRERFVRSLVCQGFSDEAANEVAQSLGFHLEIHRGGVAALRRRTTPLFERVDTFAESRNRMDALQGAMRNVIDGLRFDFELAVLIADVDQPHEDKIDAIMKMHDTVRYLSDQLSKVDAAKAHFSALVKPGEKTGRSIEANFAKTLVKWLQTRNVGYSEIEEGPYLSAARWAWLYFGFTTDARSAIREVRRREEPAATSQIPLEPGKPAGPFDGLGSVKS